MIYLNKKPSFNELKGTLKELKRADTNLLSAESTLHVKASLTKPCFPALIHNTAVLAFP